MSILIKVYFGLAHPHLTSHLIIWGAAPPSHMKALQIRINNMLRIILGVAWMNGRPLATTRELYERLGLLNLDSLFKYNLYKFLHLMLDGKLPDFMGLLLTDHVTVHAYNTRQIRYRHPALSCEVERRALPHQLIVLYESLPNDVLTLAMNTSLRRFKTLLYETQF